MDINKIGRNLLLSKIIANSTFTERQIQIIYKVYNKEKKPADISAGAYYRQIKQCKDKIRKIHYSFIILSLVGLLDNESIIALKSIVQKVNSLDNNISEINHGKDIDNVINIINLIINKISL